MSSGARSSSPPVKLFFPVKEPPRSSGQFDAITAPGFSVYDQWEAQLLAIIALRARVGLKSELDPAEVLRAHLEPVEDISCRIAAELAQRGDVPVAVLPEGPMTIPYLA